MNSGRRHLFFHAPCFDGLVSAAMTCGFLEVLRGWKSIRPQAVNYGVRSRWLRLPGSAPFAVVDFLYHPRAEFWADHHATTFLTPDLESDFRRRKSRCVIYERRAPACAELLWRHLWSAYRYRNDHFEEMVEWAARIDSAAYRTVDEAISGAAPALSISLALSQIHEPTDCESLVSLFRTMSLDEIARQPVIRNRAMRARRLLDGGLRRFKRAAHLDDDIVVFDVDAEGTLVSRYAPYRFFPRARYSAGILRGEGGTKITAMRNPWLSFSSAPLGAIFRKIGGGGHERVGSVVLKPRDAKRAPELLAEVVSAIRMHDRGRTRTA